MIEENMYDDPNMVFGEDDGPGGYLRSDVRWRPVPENPNYKVSENGDIWSSKSHRLLKPKKIDKEGHVGIGMNVNGERKYPYLHRLVAKAFIPNPENKPIVRHLNDIRTDNEIDNLAWGTVKDNMQDAKENGLLYSITPEDREIGLAKLRKPIVAINEHTGEKRYFSSITEAAKSIKACQANVSAALHGRRRRAGNYIFEEVNNG